MVDKRIDQILCGGVLGPALRQFGSDPLIMLRTYRDRLDHLINYLEENPDKLAGCKAIIEKTIGKLTAPIPGEPIDPTASPAPPSAEHADQSA